MPRVSRKKLKEKGLQNINMYFIRLLSSIKKDEEMKGFIEDFFTSEEKIMISKRLIIFMMIKAGYNSSEIQSTLNISYETLRTYRNQLPFKNKIFSNIIDKLVTADYVKRLFQKINNYLKPINTILNAKTNMRARAKLANTNFNDY